MDKLLKSTLSGNCYITLELCVAIRERMIEGGGGGREDEGEGRGERGRERENE